ncbi:MAG: hypothetical protein V3U76_12620 [Granulosicoccus sp.]
MDTIYIERAVADHERTQRIVARYPSARCIPIERFGDVFNAPAQNFRTQKQAPALLLAQKHGRRVLPTPPAYHIGGKHNFYFSHMLNCVYDCRYCFLQGMYRSANHVVFVNFESFFDDIVTECSRHTEPSWYFSGYDCDSLALDPITGFVDSCLDHFQTIPNACLELRTKSTQIRPLLKRDAMNNVVVAYSLSPEPVIAAEEHGTPSLAQRLEALSKLQTQGWRVGLRFDPILQADNFEALYGSFFQQVFDSIDMQAVHSVSLGTFRLPKSFHKRIVKLYPEARLLATELEQQDNMLSYPAEVESYMMDFCKTRLHQVIRPDQYFPTRPA